MKKWLYLEPGDLVDVVAPSSYSSREEIKNGILYLKSLGLRVRYPVGLVKPDFVYANSLSNTLHYFKKALNAKDSKAVWCLRGGSGTFRLLPELKKFKKPNVTKLFVGISDITLLHTYLNQEWDWSTVHGPMISMLGKSKSNTEERKSLEDIILGKRKDAQFARLVPLNQKAKSLGALRAPVFGGNLCIVESSLGTPYEAQFKNRIAFLEDIDERGYAIERSFYHLENSRAFLGVKAVVFGDFVGGNERDGRNLTNVALKRFAQRCRVPVFKGLPSGHGSTVLSVPLNTNANLTGGTRGLLVCDTGGRWSV